MFNQNVLADKVAVITGGGRGIGKAIVIEMAKAGADVVFFYNSSVEKATALQDELRNQDLKVTAMQMDVRNREQVTQVIDKIVDEKGKIDVLVNNSGIIRDGLLMGFSEDEIRDVFDTNIIGTMNVTQAVTPY